MKKTLSVASLTLHLTWVRVLGLFTLVGVLQWLLTPNPGTVDSFEEYLRIAALVGKAGFLLLFFLQLDALCRSGKGRTDYTWRRLRIPEGWATVISGLVISGWFFLYWGFQLGICLGLYEKFNRFWQYGQEYLMLSAFRTEYLHLLLPVGEPWAVVRNVLFPLVSGNLLATAVRMSRRGKNSAPRVIFFLYISRLPGSQSIASQTDDILTMILWLGLIASYWIRDWRWMKHEAP